MTDLPDYDHPPVREVVCGILFESLKNLLAPHLGLLWESFRAEYPTCRQVAPLASPVERFGKPAKVEEVEVSDVPPLPRVWFVHRDENAIIQVQQDRFLYNWRKVRQDDEYPRYGAVIAKFRDQLEVFVSFLHEQSIGEMTPVQYEMTYVNEILRGSGWDHRGQIGEVFPDLSWRPAASRFLSEPESVNCRFTFQMPEQKGRLHVAMRSAERRDDDQEVLLLELTARGISDAGRMEAMWDWYGLAHEWIVQAFADLTGDRIQRDIWGRRV
jgi:uncharacterized protein (TIGR04255 family)